MPKTEQARASALSSDKARDKRQQDELNQEPEGYADLTPEKENPANMGKPPSLDDERQNEAGADLAEERQREMAGGKGQPLSNRILNNYLSRNKLDFSDTISENGKKITDPKTAAKARLGAVGQELRQRIATGSFTMFIPALLLGLAKDGIEIAAALGADPGITGDIVGLIITPILAGLLSCQQSWLKRKLKQVLGQITAGVFAEFIPVINIFPTYTIGIVWLFLMSRKEKLLNSNALLDLEQTEKQMGGKTAEAKVAPAPAP